MGTEGCQRSTDNRSPTTDNRRTGLRLLRRRATIEPLVPLQLGRRGEGEGEAVSDWQVWLIAGVLLLVAEMFTPGFWLACLAIGASAAGVLALPPAGSTPLERVVFAGTRPPYRAGRG